MSRTVIIGGGIAGLATAFYLQACGLRDFTLIERSDTPGGKITSHEENGFLVEGGPDSFLAQRSVMRDFCQVLGLEDQLAGSSTGTDATTYVWSAGRLHPMPEGMMLMAPTMLAPFLRSSLISWPGKARMGMEFFVPRNRTREDESLASFVRRRLGTEALNKIAGPLMAGIHAADPERLSLQSTFPMFLQMEQTHGSLLRAMVKRQPPKHSATGAKPSSTFLTLRGGLQQLANSIVERLPLGSVRCGRSVVQVQRGTYGYKVLLDDGSLLIADDVVFATPAYITADLLQQIDPLLSTKLRSIRYVSTATVSLGFRKSDVRRELRGSGFIVPRSEGRRITACSWSSQKFPHRAPEGNVLMRVFVGGALAESDAEQSEAALVQLAREELRAILGITAEPVLAKAYRWHKASPQYEVGHQARIQEIELCLTTFPGLHLAGAAYHGAGIPDCIQSAMQAVRAIADRRTAMDFAGDQQTAHARPGA
ncbi:MAG TPA: protoporphyrinogen oxidase [Acidobacteriaceae bacterium]|nr:protoporphyrinogen oxidase [Acidobacteriaceae bacterium]